jgi:hypothetical protein
VLRDMVCHVPVSEAKAIPFASTLLTRTAFRFYARRCRLVGADSWLRAFLDFHHSAPW